MKDTAAAILVIEDEPHARTLLRVTLAHEGYYCLHASTGAAGIAAALNHTPHIVLLDLGLPDLDGVEVTRRIREHSAVPIIVVSARGQEADKIAALDGGANDFVTKPFVAGELLARIRVALRGLPSTRPATEAGVITIGDLSIDFDSHTVRVAGAPAHLTRTEFRLLGVMMRSAGRILTNQQILRQVWGASHTGQVNSLRVYMKKLRYKIEKEPARPKYLINEIGVGYRLRLPQ